MIDKFIINFLASIDNFCSALAKMLESKPKKNEKKRSVKTVIVTVIAKQSFIFIIMMVMFVFVMPVLVKNYATI